MTFSAAHRPDDPVVPSWIADQTDWTDEERARATAILDRRTRMSNTISIQEMLRLMGKGQDPVPG